MSSSRKERAWFKPSLDFDECEPPSKKSKNIAVNTCPPKSSSPTKTFERQKLEAIVKIDPKSWMKNFDPVTVEDLAVNNKKVQDVDEWLKVTCSDNHSDMLLLTGPVGCGKTATICTLAKKHNIKVTEWITPIDIEIPSENGEFEFREKQSTKFLDFIIKAANFTSLLDSNTKKLVLVEDFPNTFLRSPSEFTEVLHQYKCRAKSPIVFICSETYSDNKNSAVSLFTPSIQEQFQVQHIAFNGVSATGLRSALKRVAELIGKKHTSVYNVPTSDMIECVVNSSTGDVRSAVLNLHFACLKGGNCDMETSIIMSKETKTKTVKKKKQSSSKFLSLGKDQTVSILHGVGRVLNPKVITDSNGQRLSHSPIDIVEQFLGQPSSFINFLGENYLPHFSSIDHVDKAVAALSDADIMIAEWREKICQEYGMYVAVAGLMLANKAPVSAWNPVRGPKNIKIKYPSPQEFPALDQAYLYKGKVLATDYKTYLQIINSKNNNTIDNYLIQ